MLRTKMVEVMLLPHHKSNINKISKLVLSCKSTLFIHQLSVKVTFHHPNNALELITVCFIDGFVEKHNAVVIQRWHLTLIQQ